MVYYVFQFLFPVIIFTSFFPPCIFFEIMLVELFPCFVIDATKMVYQSLEITLPLHRQVCLEANVLY
jgi:hypothetical protein